ncbi:hypothetical protein [Bacillus toyonensis]|uniref:hypothetical protein n=1 Tax=Bacillus toyonensis TaxID=155322 RepID=UPI0009B20009|nr:hypothetical protein [Bacillus toyonensis]OQD35989.1 hypothetical protein B1K97_00447 [Bacillus toyonensis]
MNKSGRKTKLTKDQVKEIIYLYKTEENISGQIKYLEIYEFANTLFKEERIDIHTSESFWRKKGRLGRLLVDEANSVFSHRIPIQNYNTLTIPNIVDIIDKNYSTKEELIKSLLPIEKLIQRGFKKEIELKQKNEDYKKQLFSQQEKNKELQKTLDHTELLLFTLYHHISAESNDKTKTITIKAMDSLFSNPTSFFHEFKDSSIENDPLKHLVSIKNDKKPSNLSNRFKNKFN